MQDAQTYMTRHETKYVEAIQWDGSIDHAADEVDRFTNSAALLLGEESDLRLEIEHSPACVVVVKPHDFIVKDPETGFWVVTPEVFKRRYQTAKDGVHSQLAEADRLNGELMRRLELHSQTIDSERARYEQRVTALRAQNRSLSNEVKDLRCEVSKLKRVGDVEIPQEAPENAARGAAALTSPNFTGRA